MRSTIISRFDLSGFETDHTFHLLTFVDIANREDKFWNIRSDWVETEVAIYSPFYITFTFCLTLSLKTQVALDYNAPLLTLTAQALTLNSSTPPFYTSLQAGAYSVPSGSPCDAAIPCSSKKLSKGAIVAIAVVVVVVVLALAGLVAWWFGGWFGKKKRGFRA